MKFSVIILAAGSGSRTGLKRNKVLYEIHDKKVLDYSIEFFQKQPFIESILLVVSKSELTEMYEAYNDQVTDIIIGGDTRQESVYNGLQRVTTDFVLIHDGARPFLSKESIISLKNALEVNSSVTLAVPVKNTISEIDGNRITKTLNRDTLVMIQTPQGFRTKTIKTAHEKAQKDGYLGTDDTMLVAKYMDIDAVLVQGDYRNIKLTTLDDIKFLEVVL